MAFKSANGEFTTKSQGSMIDIRSNPGKPHIYPNRRQFTRHTCNDNSASIFVFAGVNNLEPTTVAFRNIYVTVRRWYIIPNQRLEQTPRKRIVTNFEYRAVKV